MSRPLVVDPRLTIPAAEIAVTAARSSGPGGQNVNKVNSKALLRWNIFDSQSLPDAVREQFLARFPTRVNKSGEVVLTCEVHRDFGRNVSDCYEKLRQLLLVAQVVTPTRKKSKPTFASIQKRLTNKRRQSMRKQGRGFRSENDE